MDAQIHKRLTLILTLVVITATVTLLLHTTEFSIGLCLLSCTFVVVVLIRDYIMKIDLHQPIGVLFLFFQLALALFISVMSEDFFAQVYILILIGEFTFHHSRNHSIIFTIVSYAGCLLSLWTFHQFPPFEPIYYAFPRVIEYFAIFGISLLAKIAFQQKNQLAKDNEQLRIASIELERKAILQERTRISREIHDSVGHTLTSALTGLQTAAHAIGKNHYSLALEMIDRTKENILSGLDDVRTSVHLLRENMPEHQFIPELIGLIEETKRQTNVEIAYEIDRNIPDLSPMIELTIYRALQEGLTNGIRHGSSTYFQFSLNYYTGHIRFILSDNGKAPNQINYGFGLNAMKERVEDVAGEMSISNQNVPSGVTLEITIPIQTKPIERSERIV
ncbi:sensor histidine kinase [Paenibacillus radicis (ex Xue et al. 2023)]|uniref:histidine kinase n=1 Tax=Paenibacillus radicis (ex Xue et al. 2023) TaxID=2972489 RepID=A0ABT1YEH4_9BACL|nr:sensor histidine kinase [Paenibacillus radicis (ex Xue et al. 2023)]MCR8631160.1 sensor histidine kinase [Paenibacillus radicis (ex Xue et al. 2023)]